jgi:hypothetical protein
MPDWLVIHESPLWTYASVSPQLRQLASRAYQPVYTIRATKGPSRSAVYDLQDAFFMPFTHFWTVERLGTTITIYRRLGPPDRP